MMIRRTNTHPPTHYRATIYLQFIQSKPPASPDFGIILEGRTPDNGSQWSSCGSRCHLRCLLSTLTPSPLLLARLVEPSLHVPLPMLLKVGIGYHAISVRGHLGALGTKAQHTRIYSTCNSLTQPTDKVIPKLRLKPGQSENFPTETKINVDIMNVPAPYHLLV